MKLDDLLWEVSESATYKPGSMVVVKRIPPSPFEVERDTNEQVQVYVSVRTIDSRAPHGPYRLGTTAVFFAYPVRSMLADGKVEEARAYVQSEVRKACHILETHEADEFLRFDGVARFDPHKEANNA